MCATCDRVKNDIETPSCTFATYSVKDEYSVCPLTPIPSSRSHGLRKQLFMVRIKVCGCDLSFEVNGEQLIKLSY